MNGKYSNQSDLRIIHISPKYFAKETIGGGERYPLELTKALSKYANVTLIAFGNKKQTDNINNLKIKEYPALHSLIFDDFNPFSISFLKDIKNADVVHLHQFRKIITSISIPYSKIKGKGIFVTDHAGGGMHFSMFFGHLVDYFLTVSEFSKKDFLRYNTKTQVIYGGVDVTNFYPRNVEREKKVLFVGKITPHKGCDYLVKAVQDLDVKLYMIGVPPNLEYEKLLMSLDRNNKMKFKFNVSDEDLAKEYSSSVVTVLPSVYKDCYGSLHRMPELLGLTLLESMACGTPVIGTNVGGMPEIVKDDKTGFIVNPNDSNALKEKIRYFINNFNEVEKMGGCGRKEVLEKYTWDAVAKRCLSAYNEYLKEV